MSEAPGPAKIQRTAGRAAANLMRSRGIAVAALSVAAVGAVGATVLVAAQQRKRASDSELPESVEKYSASLRAYLEAARKGALDAGTVSQLISDLDAVKEHSGNGGITIDFSTGQPEALVNLVVDYTSKLAKANSIELSELQRQASASDSNAAFVVLRRHLEIQRQILTRTT